MPRPAQIALQLLTAQMKALLALPTASFGPHESIKASVVIARVDAVLSAAGGEDEETADASRDRAVLMMKVRAYERGHGGFYGTGF